MTNELQVSDKMELFFTPVGEREQIKLSPSIIKKFIANPTKSGAMPSDKDIMGFMMLCNARALNPFVGDAYLVGYDSQSGPSFSLITAKSAYDKRAELNEHFDGMESGLVILKDNAIERREGAIYLPGEKIIGAWAVVFRKDRGHVVKHDVNIMSYDTDRSQWKTNKAGMIIKCAEAGVLRKAFPNTYAGMYIAEESDAVNQAAIQAEVTEVRTEKSPQKALPEQFKRSEKVQDAEPEKEVAKETPKQIRKPKPEPKEEPEPEKKPVEDAPPKETVKAPLSEQHKKLQELAVTGGFKGIDICSAANIFFGINVSEFADIPESNCATMIGNWDDVKDQIVVNRKAAAETSSKKD